MKRSALIQHIETHGACFVREGRRHTIYSKGNVRTSIPRHSEIVDELVRKICKDLNIPFK
jgi:mRNA interferase HicA